MIEIVVYEKVEYVKVKVLRSDVLPEDRVATLALWHPVVVKLEEWNSVKRLFTDADEITADATVQDSLLRHQHQLAVHLEKTDPWKNVKSMDKYAKW